MFSPCLFNLMVYILYEINIWDYRSRGKSSAIFASSDTKQAENFALNLLAKLHPRDDNNTFPVSWRLHFKFEPVVLSEQDIFLSM